LLLGRCHLQLRWSQSLVAVVRHVELHGKAC
jgi:hypothetical protein